MTRLGLHMIVKNEAPVIERCLRSVLPLIDWWVIADTGSTDGTQDIVRRALADVPGQLVEHEWVNFGHNRQAALEVARQVGGAGDYVMWLDADEQLVDTTGRLPDLSVDGYTLRVEYGGTRYHRLAIIRLDQPWTWSGVIHEHLQHPTGGRLEHLDAPSVLVRHDGARSRDPETYRKDAQLLADELARHPDDPRLQFYRAQSLRDAGEHQAALDAYRIRADNPHGWDQERWHAMWQIGRLLQQLGHPPADIADAHLAAYDALPSRAEPLVDLAALERGRGRHHAALLYARTAAATPHPGPDALFVDLDTYTWRAHDELAIAAYWAGHHDEGRAAANRALAARPDDERLVANLAFFTPRNQPTSNGEASG
jgi:tetratricopeptide (TPR) repeat protein